MGSLNPLPYWQVNLPPSEREVECPEFLRNLSAKDVGIISTPDSAYHILTWPEVRAIITSNRIDLFQRLPSALRRYLSYNYDLKRTYGSVMAFVVSQRLQWDEPVLPAAANGEAAGEAGSVVEAASSSTPFGNDERDVKILYNDWPYGIDERIVHLVVWTKFVLEEDEATGDLTSEARAAVDEWVDERFVSRCGRENVIWFKNWKSLKSIHAVEHFHIMLFDPDPEFVKEITNGDIPLSQKV